jgi:hypothetical protein
MLHPLTRAEAIALGYQEGWLAFESLDGEVRKRLALYPDDWARLSDAEVERLLEAAEVAPPRKSGPGAGGAERPESPGGRK